MHTLKTLLVLGGTPYQIPAIQYAQSQGHRVITCDYLPNNPGHRLADAYFNVSTTDRSAVLQLARQQQVDGILAFASDPAAPTAAYVAEQLKLPGNPLQAVETLTQKDLFRACLQSNGFNCPRHQSARSLEESRASLNQLHLPVVIKPVDSSGSKGVSRINRVDQLPDAFERALKFSRCQRVIIEEWIERHGYQIAGDGFVVDGQLVFHCLAQEHFDGAGFVPIGESFPLRLAPHLIDKVTSEIQRLIDCVGIKSGELNFDVAVDRHENIYLIEIGPRSGGNFIPQAIRLATGVDLTAKAVDAALGLDCSDLQQVPCRELIATLVVHARSAGRFDHLWISPELDVVEQQLFASPGDEVQPLSGSHCTLGILLVRFLSHSHMLHVMQNFQQYYEVVVQPTPPERGHVLMTQDSKSVHAPYFPDRQALSQYLDDIYENGWLTNHGPLACKLEERLAEYLDVPYVVLVANGTLALQLAIRLLGLKGEVITTPLSFVATANALEWEGISPRFADVCPQTFGLDPQQLPALVNANTSAIVPVHLFGQACDVQAIQEVADRWRLPVIYDAAQAFGLMHNGRNVLRYGDVSVLSFHATKIFHTVEGGALVLHDQVTYQRALRYRSHGRVDAHAPPGLGINAKISEVHAAVGHCMLDEMQEIQQHYHQLRQLYRGRLGQVRGIRLPPWSEIDQSHSIYMPILVDDVEKRKAIEELMRAAGIQPRRYFDPPLHRLGQFSSEDPCPVADDIAARLLLLPMPTRQAADIANRTCDLILTALHTSMSCQM